MKLTLFQCDICKKEHKREVVVKLMFENWDDMTLKQTEKYSELCVECETAIKAVIEKRKK